MIVKSIKLVAENGCVAGCCMADRHVSLPKSIVTGEQWLTRFEICNNANGWNNEKIAVKLPTLLEEEDLALWLELSEEEQKDYKVTKEKLIVNMKTLLSLSMSSTNGN